MPTVTPDLSDVQDPFEPGEYKVRVTGYKFDEWPPKDGRPSTKYVNWELSTFSESETKNNGRKLFHRTPLNGGGAFRIQRFYSACTGEQLKKGESFDTDMLMGRELAVVVEINDKGYTEIRAEKRLQ